jgi:hypothetical protein
MSTIYTYQDFETAQQIGAVSEFVGMVINSHKSTQAYRMALDADEYDAERNVTISNFARWIYTGNGQKQRNDTVSNMKLASNYFARCNTQRCTYSLGNGITFQADGVEDKLGRNADHQIYTAGYYGLIHGLSFLYWAYDHIHVFKLTEFAPLWDEMTSELRAGVRFWQMAPDRPLMATLYTADGYLDFKSEDGSTGGLKPQANDCAPYRMTIARTPATTGDVITAHNYGALPIIPLWGSRLHQSTLVGLRTKIDAFDIVHSGFANDMQDCAQIYWLINNAAGMTEKDLTKFRERLLYQHIANVNTADGVDVKPYTQEIPYNAREALLNRLENSIYADFGYMNPSSIGAGSKTATEINSAYQPLDENADDFEYQVIDAVQALLALQGVPADDATPQFKRNRISNQKEQVEIIMLEAPYLDDETILSKLPNISSEEIDRILQKKDAEDLDRLTGGEVTENAEI